MKDMSLISSGKIRELIIEELDKDSRNIPRELKRRSLQETCDFISENMPYVPFNFCNQIEILQFAIKKAKIDGLWIEFGVYKGQTVNLIAKKSNKLIYGFDSFEGLPETWRADYRKGTFKINKIPQYHKNVVLVKGSFEDTIPLFIKSHPEQISFMHIDCDLYSSTKTIFDNFEKQIATGTIICFDEYFNYPGWKNGEFKAFSEFTERTEKKFEYLGYVYRHSQVIVKIIQ